MNTQNDRQIDVYLDPRGNHGKTWITQYLWERGLACVVPRACGSAEKISSFVCSSYKGEPYVIVDIPRASKIRPELYEALEELKDGLVYDHRYSGRTRNIRGARIIVFTNLPFDRKKLSHDRWRLHGVENAPAVGKGLPEFVNKATDMIL